MFPGRLDSKLGGIHDALLVQSGNFNHSAAKLSAQSLEVNIITVLADKIHHVYGDHHRNACFRKLSCQIQISLQVCAIDDVQNDIRLILDQVVSGYHLFQCIW